MPLASLFGPIYAYVRTAAQEAVERVRRGAKACLKCGQERPLDDFNTCARAGDGHRPECRDCQRATARARYRAKSATG